MKWTDRRFIARRGRAIVCTPALVGLVFLAFLYIDIVFTDSSVSAFAFGLVMLPFFVALAAIVVRATKTLDLTLELEVVKYRTMFRTRVLSRSDISECRIEEVAGAYGLGSAVRPCLRLADGKTVPLRLFGGVKPDASVTATPTWFQQMNQVVDSVAAWLSTATTSSD
jgi:hypothetical protein